MGDRFILTFASKLTSCSLEAFARICVSGLLLDPEVPVSTLFQSPFATYPNMARPPNTAVEASFNIARTPSVTSTHGQSQLHRGLSVTQRLKQFRKNLARPFTLAHHSLSASQPSAGAGSNNTPSRPRSDTTQSKSPMAEKALSGAQHLHAHMRNPSEPTFLSKALRSDNSENTLSLPFRLSVEDSRGQTHRNLPYLRHSWTRIDFVAILSFWITVVLASSGVERNQYHIGLFRAMSVLRTARLLAITSGTTVSILSIRPTQLDLTWWCADDHAISEDCSPTSRQRFIFRAVRNDSLLVSLFSIPFIKSIHR